MYKKGDNKKIFILVMAFIFCALLIYFISNQLIKDLIFIASCGIITTLLYVISTINKVINSNHLPIEQQETILVVDDNKPNRRIILEILKPLSLNIIEASSGEEALEIFKNQTITLILLDIELQGMDGFQLTKYIREAEKNEKRLPIIAISAHNNKEKRIQALTTGFDDYLSKPVNDQALLNTLDRWLKTDTKIMQVRNEPTPTVEPNIQNHTIEFLNEKSTDNTVIIKKVVDVKQSLIFSRNDNKLAKDMLNMLLDSIKKERVYIQNLYDENKWEELSAIVHKLNGGSCYCGVSMMQTQTQLLDSALEKNDLEKVKKIFPIFLDALDELLEWDQEHDIDIIFDI